MDQLAAGDRHRSVWMNPAFDGGVGYFRYATLSRCAADETRCASNVGTRRIAIMSGASSPMRISTLISLTAVIAVLSLPCCLFADGVVFDGIGPISTGRGATN